MPDYILTVDGVNLFTTYGAYAYEREVWNTAEKEATFYSVPGRDGDILGVNTRMPDVEISYDIIIPEDGEADLQGLRNFLMSRSGRVRIEHSKDPDHFRQGIFLGPFRPKLARDRTQAKGVVTFRCQPQRWLNSGAVVVTKTSSIAKSDTNPTLFDAKPLIVIGGLTPNTNQDISLTPIIGGSGIGTIHVYKQDTMNSDNLTIDVQSQQCTYVNSSNKVVSANQYISTQEYQGAYGVDFPSIPAGGQLSVSASSYPTLTVSFTHRWWEV